MISYYDIVQLLSSLSSEPRSNNIIETLNTINIELEGDRYFRFLEHISLFIEDRLNNAYLNFNEKMLESKNYDDFMVEFKEFTDEVSFCFEIAGINLIKEENRIEIGRVVMQSNNDILDKIKCNYDDSDTMIMQTINDTYLVEKTDK